MSKPTPKRWKQAAFETDPIDKNGNTGLHFMLECETGEKFVVSISGPATSQPLTYCDALRVAQTKIAVAGSNSLPIGATLVPNGKVN